jgi:glutathione S-transferase
MIELIQFPWSNFCIVQRRILEFSGVRFKITNIPSSDRSLVWKLTGKKYYAVPIIKDGAKVVFESGDDTQDVARHLDAKLKLGLFPAAREGEQTIIWRYLEHDLESVSFKLNDLYWQDFVPPSEQLNFLRYKERKFGCGCLDHWRARQKEMLGQLEKLLLPFEQMLAHSEFLLDARPLFVDFELFGMLENFLFSGHYALPKSHPQIRRWHARMKRVRRS